MKKIASTIVDLLLFSALISIFILDKGGIIYLFKIFIIYNIIAFTIYEFISNKYLLPYSSMNSYKLFTITSNSILEVNDMVEDDKGFLRKIVYKDEDYILAENPYDREDIKNIISNSNIKRYVLGINIVKSALILKLCLYVVIYIYYTRNYSHDIFIYIIHCVILIDNNMVTRQIIETIDIIYSRKDVLKNIELGSDYINYDNNVDVSRGRIVYHHGINKKGIIIYRDDKNFMFLNLNNYNYNNSSNVYKVNIEREKEDIMVLTPVKGNDENE